MLGDPTMLGELDDVSAEDFAARQRIDGFPFRYDCVDEIWLLSSL